MSVQYICYVDVSILKIIFYQSVTFKINVENMLKLRVVLTNIEEANANGSRQISVEIFDENICSEAQEI